MSKLVENASHSQTLESDKSILEPNKVIWKYFVRNAAGEVVCSSEKPEGKEVVALINSSSWFPPRKATPRIVKKAVAMTLNSNMGDLEENIRPDICVAIPCSPLEEMKKYYGKEALDDDNETFLDDLGNKIESEYISARIHDDLRNGDVDYFNLGMRVLGTMPPKEGGEQIASAIENGFNIWSYSGGNTIFPKLQLCEKYFAAKETPEVGKKVYFAGFSNGSTMQFYLKGLVKPIHYFGAMWSLIGRDKEMNNLMFKAFEGGDVPCERIMNEEKEGDLEKIKERYEALKEDEVITNVTFFPHGLGVTIDSTFANFKNNEKLILGLEGYSQMSEGHNVSEALFRALESGAINHEQILFISIEDIIQQSEQFKVRRINGLIPNLEDLDNEGKRDGETEKECIEGLAAQQGISPEEYIVASNIATNNEINRIKEVAEKFNIPVVNGGQRRAGHAKCPVLQPANVSELVFGENSITQKSILTRGKKENLPSFKVKDTSLGAPSWSKLSLASVVKSGEKLLDKISNFCYSRNPIEMAQDEVAENEIRASNLTPLNSQAVANDSDIEEIVAGGALNLVEVNANYITGKGLVVHLPFKGSVTPVTESHQIIASGQLKEAKFLVFSTAIPDGLSDSDKSDYLENRDKIFKKLIDDFKIEKPVYITSNSVNEANLAPIFSGTINLKKMVVSPSITPAVSEGREDEIRGADSFFVR